MTRIRSKSNAIASAVAIAVVLIGSRSGLADPDETPATTAAAGVQRDADADAAQPTEAQQVTLPLDAMRKYGIRTAPVKKQKLTSHVIAPGRIAFDAEALAVVGVAVPGRVSEVKVRVGDTVAKGDALLVIESPELGEAQSDLLQKRTAIVTANAAVDPAKSALDRAKALYDQSQGITLTELQKREVDYTTAQNAVLTAQAAAAAAENKLRLLGMDQDSIDQVVKTTRIDPHLTVRSPLDGTVTERTVNLGELVTPEREKLIAVADMTTLWALIDVPEGSLHEVAEQAKVKLTVSAAGERSFTGTVSRIAASLNEATRSAEVRVELKGDPALKPGMFAQADIASRANGEGGDATVLAVPAEAVQTLNGSTAVFVPVKGQENTFRPREVRIGDAIGGFVTIASGLDEGETVVTSGTFILKADLLKSSAKDED